MKERHCRMQYNDTFTYAAMYSMALRHVAERHANGTRCDDVNCGWNRRTGRSLSPSVPSTTVLEESRTAVKSTGDDVVFARVQVCCFS